MVLFFAGGSRPYLLFCPVAVRQILDAQMKKLQDLDAKAEALRAEAEAVRAAATNGVVRHF